MSATGSPRPLTSSKCNALQGSIDVPGDKSISHRALIFGALAVGRTEVRGLLEGDDVLRTAAALRNLGARIERGGDGTWTIDGLGVGGLQEPAEVLDLGNSGTGARLLMGAVASHPFTSFFTGDASLCRRPMGRVAEPLERMGARFVARSRIRPPLAVIGTGAALPIEYQLPVASAQVKSAILLAGLNAPGITTVLEPEPTRDHTENLLRHFGATVKVEPLLGGGRKISLTGQPELTGQAVTVPGDPSSAAFAVVAAVLSPGSDVTVRNVGLNPLRAGLFDCLRDMGAAIEVTGLRQAGGEPVADLKVSGGALRGVVVPPERAPSMIDEYPILAVAAAFAAGSTTMRGIGELRVKESDRIAAMAVGLKACGVSVEEFEDGMIVHGSGRPPTGGGRIETRMDHRIAMAFLVLGLAAERAVTIDDSRMIDTSFPGFAALLNGLGARIAAAA